MDDLHLPPIPQGVDRERGISSRLPLTGKGMAFSGAEAST